MAKVKIVIRPWLSSVMGKEESGPISFEEELVDYATIGAVLCGIAARNPPFREAVFTIGAADLSGRITITLNNRLLGRPGDMDIELKEGDVLTLFPTIEGG